MLKKFVEDFITPRPVLAKASVAWNGREALTPLPETQVGEEDLNFSDFEKHEMDRIWYDFFETGPNFPDFIIPHGIDGVSIDPGSWALFHARFSTLYTTLVFSCAMSYVPI